MTRTVVHNIYNASTLYVIIMFSETKCLIGTMKTSHATMGQGVDYDSLILTDLNISLGPIKSLC